MSTCLTRYLGEIEYTDDVLIRFADGLPGYEEETAFLPIEIPSARPIVFLQSIANPDLCFVTLPVLVVDPGYVLRLRPDDLAAVGLAPGCRPELGVNVLCLAIVTIQEHGPTTANLMAPVVMNLRTRQAVQAICAQAGYSHQHPFLAACLEAAC